MSDLEALMLVGLPFVGFGLGYLACWIRHTLDGDGDA